MNDTKILWGIVIVVALVILWVTRPKHGQNVVPFKKPRGGAKKSERNHLDTVYNPKQYRRPKR